MKEQFEPIPKEMSESPLKLPLHPYWEVFKRFGIDELLAMVVNVIGTVIISFFTSAILIISITGPIVEKLGFFPMHFKEAWNVYRTTPTKQRRKFSHYLGKALKNSLTSLFEDILIHDPIYIILMLVGLGFYSETPIWLLSGASFVIAVIIVAGLEVAFREFQYLNFKRKMKKAGFEVEIYYEARFFVSSKQNHNKLLEKFIKTFNLTKIKTPLTYNDTYFEHDFPNFSGRNGKVRLRRRTYEGGGLFRTIQVVYTKTREKYLTKTEQYRFFPTKKEKIYYVFKKMPQGIKDIKNTKIRKTLKPVHENLAKTNVRFTRYVARSNELLISTDKIEKGEGFYLVELKVHSDVKLLMRAMRYLMREFPVVQTTHEKFKM
jgi:hypothetical protein